MSAPERPIMTERQVQRAVRNFFRNELIPKQGGVDWIKAEIKDYFGTLFDRSGGREDFLRKVIRDQVSQALHPYGRDRTHLTTMIEKIIREEVQATLKSRLVIKVEGSIQADIDPTRYEKESQF